MMRDLRFAELDRLIERGLGDGPAPIAPAPTVPTPSFDHIADPQLRRRFRYLARCGRWDDLEREMMGKRGARIAPDCETKG